MEDERIKVVKNWPKPKSVHDIQVFLGFANFYWYFIQGFNKIARSLTLMLRTSSPTSSSIILQSINVADEEEISENSGNETNLSNLSVSRKSNGAGYLTFGGAKRGGGNTKKGVKAAKGFNYLTSAAQKAFNYLWHVFIPTPILQHFHSKRHIWIKTNASCYAISGILS